MRRAKALDWRRRLYELKGKWSLKIERFAFDGVPSLGSGEVLVSSPLTILAGANGVGKTTLLRTLWAALNPGASREVIERSRKLTAGTAAVDLAYNGKPISREVDFSSGVSGELSDLPIIHIDGAADAISHQLAFCEFEDAEDITNGAGARNLDSAALGEINYILNRNYRSITVYEVEIGSVAPFFEVAYGDSLYDSRTMGAGEIAALYIWWCLDRIENDSIALIEEPEAFLSHGSQRNMADHIISIVVKKSLYTIVSSHSAPMIADLPKECVRFLSRSHGSIQLLNERPSPALLHSLGVEFKLIAVIFVEDILASLFAKAVIERADPALARRVHVEVREGGESLITSALRVTSTFKGGVRFIGLFDGDQRNSPPEDLKGDFAFLPGNEPVEKMFHEMVTRDASALWAQFGKENVESTLSSIEGLDLHDWFDELKRNLGLERGQLFQALFNIWIIDENNITLANDTYESIFELLEAETAA